MNRIAITGTLLAALTFPVGAMAEETAPTPKQNAAKTCKALRTAAGDANFKAAYATNKKKTNAFGKCVSKQVKIEKAAKSNAAKECKAERDDAAFADSHEGQTFAQYYGTGKNGKNAFGKCVSSKRKAANAEETETKVKAAKACKTERRELGKKEFTAKYGGRSNAFGKCISAEAKADKAARS